MNEAYAELRRRATAWFEQACAEGWLDTADQARWRQVEQATPQDLFGAGARPLVAAFFGGTGVGKSSLLNRLAGGAVARTGAVRPTSHELTLYAHETVELATLPPGAALEQVVVRRHSLATRRDVVWIDCPDFDSTSDENRRLALAWLPYIDLVIYVVSPERYRDDEGWRLLLARGRRHGWMFILNHWDTGDAGQAEDFQGLLREAGFERPLLFCTSCAPLPRSLPTPDQFREVEASVARLLDEHGVRELERLGQRARLHDLRTALQAAAARLGDADAWRRVSSNGRQRWQAACASLRAGIEWPLRLAAARFATRESGWLMELVRRAPQGRSSTPSEAPAHQELSAPTQQLARGLWDDWTLEKLKEGGDALEVELRRAHIAPAPVSRRLAAALEAAPQLGPRITEERLRLALANPGFAVQRLARRLSGFLLLAVPGLALLWVIHNVVIGYYRGSTGQAPYLGADFAVSSFMLVVVSFLGPWLLDRSLRPSLERTAQRALREGFADALREIGDSLDAALEDAAADAAARREAAQQLAAELARASLRPVEAQQETLGRALAAPR